MLTLTADKFAALEAQGFIVDEWDRWQQGGCLEYAVALQRRHPHLRFGSFGRTNISDPAYPSDDVQHHFAHDDTHAYDSAGTHLLPYLGIAGEADFCRLDEQASWYEVPHEPEVLTALAHINRHPILKAGSTMSKKPTLRKGPASSYEAPNEVIREFGNGKGDGGLLSLRNMDDGSMVVEVYQVTGPVTIHTPGVVMTPAARGYLATAAAEARVAGVDAETQEALDRVARIGITPKDINFESRS